MLNYLSGIEDIVRVLLQLRDVEDRHRVDRDGAQLFGRQQPEVIRRQLTQGRRSDAGQRLVRQRRELGRVQSGDDDAQRNGRRRRPRLRDLGLGL